MEDAGLEREKLELEKSRLEFERAKHEIDSRLATRKLKVTGLVTAMASIGIPSIVAYQNTAMERLKINAASVEHVQAVLDPQLAPDSRRRIYEYLVTAFEGTPLHQWAKQGLNESTEELDRARRERDEARESLVKLRRESEIAFLAVRNLERALASAEDNSEKVALEQELEEAKLALSSKTKALTEVSMAKSTPAELNASGLRLWRDGEQTKAREVFEGACDREYWPACFNLAGALHRGRFKNLEKAEALYRSTCAMKRAQACTDLADLLTQQGRGEDALEFYTQGCELGEARACDELDDRGVGRPEPARKGKP